MNKYDKDVARILLIIDLILVSAVIGLLVLAVSR